VKGCIKGFLDIQEHSNHRQVIFKTEGHKLHWPLGTMVPSQAKPKF